MKTAPSFRILAIDDLQSIHDDYRKILAQAGRAHSALDADEAALFGAPTQAGPPCDFRLDSAYDGQEGLRLVQRALAEKDPYAVAFVDMRMPPGWDGVETVRRIWAEDTSVQVVICTAYSDYSWSDTVGALGYPDNLIVLKKPFDHIEVQQLAFALSRKWELTRDVQGRLANLDELVHKRTTQLRAAEDRFAQAFDASPLPQLLVSLDDLRILEMNSRAEECFELKRGSETALHLDALSSRLNIAEWRPWVAGLLTGGTVEAASTTLRRLNGEVRQLRCYARPIKVLSLSCAIWMVQDVTPHLLLEEQLRQAQKMDAIGRLAAGVAHDFNNLLTVVECATGELLADEMRTTQRAHLESIQAVSLRAASLTRQLLVFSRKQIVKMESLDVGKALRELRPLLRRLITETIELKWEAPLALPAILADAGSFDQAIINLVINARDAMGLQGCVEVTVKERRFLSAQECRHAAGRAGDFVAITVADNGAGIPEEVLPRIFEPFFTTKGPEKGSGLGLHTVCSILQQHKGWIDVQTTTGAGTRFTLYFPVAESPAKFCAPAAFAGDMTQDMTLLRVLMAEDDPAIRDIVTRITSKRGIATSVFSNGQQALTAWREQGPFDVLISDIIMPGGLTGIELARQLRNEQPSLPILLMTGYSSDLANMADRPMPGRRPVVLPKPFTTAELMDALIAALHGRAESGKASGDAHSGVGASMEPCAQQT